MITPLKLLVLAAAAVTAVACKPIVVCGCTPADYAAVLHGTVTDPDGTPVDGAVVRASIAFAGCEDASHELGYSSSSADGGYRAVLRTFAALEPCLEAWAEAPAGSGLAASARERFVVEFRYQPPYDSVRVDLQLRGPQPAPARRP